MVRPVKLGCFICSREGSDLATCEFWTDIFVALFVQQARQSSVCIQKEYYGHSGVVHLSLPSYN